MNVISDKLKNIKTSGISFIKDSCTYIVIGISNFFISVALFSGFIILTLINIAFILIVSFLEIIHYISYNWLEPLIRCNNNIQFIL